MKWGEVNVVSMWSQCGVKLDEIGRKRGENGKEVSMWSQCGVNVVGNWMKRGEKGKEESKWSQCGVKMHKMGRKGQEKR